MHESFRRHREDIESNQLGSPPAARLLHALKPNYWFAAHLHCQFAALVKHENEEETKFLALDKCLPKRRHLQILDLPEEYNGDKLLKYDPEWLAVLKNTNHLLSVKNIDCHMPGPGGAERYEFTPSKEEIKKVVEVMEKLIIDKNSFVQTAPIYNPGTPKRAPSEPISNPQTLHICEKLGIDDPIQVVVARSGRKMKLYESVSSNTPDRTPIKFSKLSLPAPITPSEFESDDLSPNTLSTDTSFSSCVGDNSDCVTPPSVTKKVFKRRNLAMYTPEAKNEEVIEDSGSPLSSKTSRSG